MFLATLIVTAKYLNDSSPKNSHWAKYASLFDVAEVNLMEKQLLYLLDYDLRFDEREACVHFAPFMTSSAQDTKARASAVERVSKAGKARAKAQAQRAHSEILSTVPSEALPAALPSTLSSAVRGIARRLSSTQLGVPKSARPPPPPVPTVSITAMYSTLSTGSTSSSSSSEMGSLVDDTGSSSSSSGWTSESDSEDEGRAADDHARVYEQVTQEQPLDNDPARVSPLRPFVLRPVPSYGYKNQHLSTQDRTRKPSDSSSVHTITAYSPVVVPSSLRSRGPRAHQRDTKRSASASASGIDDTDTDEALSTSVTMPGIARTGVSGGFLSRMWGAAKGQQEKSSEQQKQQVQWAANNPENQSGDQSQGQSAFRRLVLIHSRSNIPRISGQAFAAPALDV